MEYVKLQWRQRDSKVEDVNEKQGEIRGVILTFIRAKMQEIYMYLISTLAKYMKRFDISEVSLSESLIRSWSVVVLRMSVMFCEK